MDEKKVPDRALQGGMPSDYLKKLLALQQGRYGCYILYGNDSTPAGEEFSSIVPIGSDDVILSGITDIVEYRSNKAPAHFIVLTKDDLTNTITMSYVSGPVPPVFETALPAVSTISLDGVIHAGSAECLITDLTDDVYTMSVTLETWNNSIAEGDDVSLIWTAASTWSKIIENDIRINKAIYGRFKDISISAGAAICYRDVPIS